MALLPPDLRERVRRARVAHLATVRPDGHPHVVAITFAVDGDTVVTAIDHKPKTTSSLQRMRNIRANPAAAVLVDHYDDDWDRLWWARADGTARILEEGVERDGAVDLLVEKYEPYRERRPSGPVIVIKVARWASWSAEG